MIRKKLILAAALLSVTTTQVLAGDFFCEGISSSDSCADTIKGGVTHAFTKKYPASKYRIYLAAGNTVFGDGRYAGSAVVWLGSKSSQVPNSDNSVMVSFVGSSGVKADATRNEKDALLTATQELMRKLGVGVPVSPAQQAHQVRQAAAPRCHIVQETEQTLQSDYVCDYNNLGPTNCRTENKSVPRTVDKRVCTN